nr:hypothetical protein [Mycoplasmopsis bovis]
MLNNAGIMPLDKYYEQSLQDKYDIIDTNIKGVINGMDSRTSINDKRKQRNNN